MIILKSILGFTLLVLASVNHFIIYSTRCDIGNLLNYLSLRRVEVYIALGLFALIFQLIIGFYNLLGKLDQYTCRMLGFLPLVIVLLFMNLDLFLKLPRLSYEYAKINLKADTFYVLTGLIALCLFFDKISFFRPCPIITILTMVLTVLIIISGLLLIKYMKIAYTLTDRMDVSVSVKLLLFTSMVFGFQSMASFCYPTIACWLALLGVFSLLMSIIVIVYTIRSLAII